MARLAGSEDKPGAKAPGTGSGGTDHNIVVTEGSFLQAVKEIGACDAVLRDANTARKNVRKKWKASGISLMALDRAVKMVEWDRQEVRESFSTEKRYAEWLGLPVQGVQMDAFKGLSDDDIQTREWHAVGRSYSRAGKPGKPPEECPPDFIQAFMRGFNDEDEAAWGDGGDTPDAPVETPAAAASAAPAAADPEPAAPAAEEAAAPPPALPPQGDLVDGAQVRGFFDQPDWVKLKFSDDPAEWFADQKATFRKWYDDIPAGARVLIAHLGVLAAFRQATDDERANLAEDAKPEDVPTAEQVAQAPVEAEALAMSPKDAKAAARAAKAAQGGKPAASKLN